jgi:hypothetical protein
LIAHIIKPYGSVGQGYDTAGIDAIVVEMARRPDIQNRFLPYVDDTARILFMYFDPPNT